MDNIDPFEVVDEVIEQNENEEIDLTLDEDLGFPVKQENEDVKSEDGEKDSDNEVDLQNEDCGDSVKQNGDKENLDFIDEVDETQNQGEKTQNPEGEEIQENQEDEGPSENQEDEGPSENQEDAEPQENQEASNVTLHDESEVEVSENLEKEQSDEEDLKKSEVPHPYLYIVETFGHQKQQLAVTPVGKMKNHLETNLSIITTKAGLLKLLDELRNTKEIGVEIKSPPHEYAETISLIQISTGQSDYILDAMKLNNELMMLTEIFINPKIVKIIFKPKAVLPALQKRLRLFMVNLFDIQAARAALDKPDSTFSAILRSEFKVEKPLIPTVDFRKRPLPQDYKDMLKIDIHYHVYLYRRYRNELIKKDFGKYTEFLEKCRSKCKVIYPDFKQDTFKMLETELKQRHKCEYEVLRKLYNWRHQLSLKSNINPETLLRRNGLMKLVKHLPITEHEIWECTRSKHVKKDIEKIRTMILELKTSYNIPTEKSRPPEQTFKAAKKRGANTSYGPQNTKHPKVYTEFLNKLANDRSNTRKEAKYFLRKNKPERREWRDRGRSVSPVRNTVTPWAPNFPENRNYSESVFLNPTNVPSPFTFQTNEFNQSHEENFPQTQVSSGGFPQPQVSSGGFPQPQISSGGFPQARVSSGGFPQARVSSGGFPQAQMSSGGFPQAQMSTGTYSQSEGQWGNSPTSRNSIQNSYRGSQQNNTFRRLETSFPVVPNANSRQDFRQIDQQISSLDRKFKKNKGTFNNQTGSFNNRNFDDSLYRRY